MGEYWNWADIDSISHFEDRTYCRHLVQGYVLNCVFIDHVYPSIPVLGDVVELVLVLVEWWSAVIHL